MRQAHTFLLPDGTRCHRVWALEAWSAAAALLALGMFVLGGIGTAHAQAEPASLSRLIAQAKAGNAAARFQLGVDYESGGDGLPKNPAMAVKWYEKSAAQGFAPAECRLGLAYDNGFGGLPKNPAMVVRWFEKSAAQGFAPAQYNLGVDYAQGKDGMPKNPAMAVRWFEKSAAQGQMQAEYELAIAYDFARYGMRKNPTLAAQWYEKAAAQGFAPAQYNLGVDYAQGKDGLPKNPALAMELYQKAAAQGFAPAITALHTMQRQAQASSSQPAAAVAADNQRLAQSLQSFWRMYFRQSNAKLIDFGTPALVQPVSFGRR